MIRNKVLPWPSLSRELKRERRQKRTIVFTNGCFDLLHVGHLKVFEKSKALGDVLVVGLNSDRSVRRLKGPGRPVVPQGERARLLAGFEVVDYVVLFNEDTPQRLIRAVRPDIVVKGGDWKASQIVGRNIAKKVVRVPLVRGRSTTDLIERIVTRFGGTGNGSGFNGSTNGETH